MPAEATAAFQPLSSRIHLLFADFLFIRFFSFSPASADHNPWCVLYINRCLCVLFTLTLPGTLVPEHVQLTAFVKAVCSIIKIRGIPCCCLRILSPFKGSRSVCFYTFHFPLFPLSQVARRQEVFTSQRNPPLPMPHHMFTLMKSCTTLLSWWLRRMMVTSWSRYV